MFDFRRLVITTFRKEIERPGFIEICRGDNKVAFTRNRVFKLDRLITIIMLLSTSYQREINRFCKLLYKGDYNIRQATAGALTQARAKLNPLAFKHLHDLAVEIFYKGANYQKWNNYRLLAVDGSVLNLPSSQSIQDEFGFEEYIQKASGKKSMARCSLLYDVKNQITLDAQIAGYRVSEKALLKMHLDYVEPGDLILGDRGYASSTIIHWLSALKVDFCIRMVDYKMRIVKDFLSSDLQETEIEIKVNPKVDPKDGLDKDLKPIKVRIIKIELETGVIELLATSLKDTEKFTRESFKELYHLRWGVEEVFKMLKSRIGLDDWSGRTARSIYQDFYAKILMMILCATLSYPIEQKVRAEYAKEKKENKYAQKINRTDAMSETKDNLIKIFLHRCNQKFIDIMDEIIESSRITIRPNRKSERIKTVKKRKPLNYKKI